MVGLGGSGVPRVGASTLALIVKICRRASHFAFPDINCLSTVYGTVGFVVTFIRPHVSETSWAPPLSFNILPRPHLLATDKLTTGFVLENQVGWPSADLLSRRLMTIGNFVVVAAFIGTSDALHPGLSPRVDIQLV